MTGCVKRQDCAPKTDVDTQVFTDRDPLDDPVGRIFNAQDSDVDTRGQPGVLSMTNISMGIKISI